MSTCVCDYDGGPAEFIYTARPRARAWHKCDECQCGIEPGERYEYTVGKWDGRLADYKTCLDCLVIRDQLEALLPCFCWYYQHMLDDAHEAIASTDFMPGVKIGLYRLFVLHRDRARNRRA